MISNHFLRWPHPLHTTTHTPSDNGCTTDRLKLTKVPITNVIRSHVVTSGGKILPFVAFAFTSSRGWTVGPFINPPMLFICTTIYLITWVIESTMLSVWNNMVLLFFGFEWNCFRLFNVVHHQHLSGNWCGSAAPLGHVATEQCALVAPHPFMPMPGNVDISTESLKGSIH